MEHKQDVQQLIDDLLFVKKAITKNSNILRFIDLGGLLSRVVFAAGIITILLSGSAYLAIRQYGSFAQIPAGIRGGILFLFAALVIFTGIMKLRSLLTYAKKGNNNITVNKLFREIYTPQALHIIIPYLTAMILVTTYLLVNHHSAFLVPALSVLTGLLCLAYVNVFHMKELIFCGDWLLATGLLTLFLTGTLHPLLALIITFGLGFCTIYPANKFLERHQ